MDWDQNLVRFNKKGEVTMRGSIIFVNVKWLVFTAVVLAIVLALAILTFAFASVLIFVGGVIGIAILAVMFIISVLLISITIVLAFS